MKMKGICDGRMFVSSCSIQVGINLQTIAFSELISHWPVPRITNSRTVTCRVSLHSGKLNTILSFTCFQIQLKMPSNQATVGRIDAALARLETVAAKLGIESSIQKRGKHNTEDLLSLIERLEAVADKLEGQSEVSGEGSGKVVEFYDQFLKGKINTFFKLSDELGGDVKTQVAIVQKAFQAQREFLVKASKTRMPPKNVTASMINPTVQLTQDVEAFRDSHRTSSQISHLSAVSEGIAALAWLGAPGKPDIFVRDRKDSAVFYTNRVLKECKGKDPKHGEWAHSFIAALIELQEYCKEFHPMGVAWSS